jgi:hypothetical protein
MDKSKSRLYGQPEFVNVCQTDIFFPIIHRQNASLGIHVIFTP